MKPVRIMSGTAAGLAPDRLNDEELAELHRLLGEWEQHEAAARVAKDRVQLLVLVAKDRRGILGPVEVRPEDGRIVRIDPEASRA